MWAKCVALVLALPQVVILLEEEFKFFSLSYYFVDCKFALKSVINIISPALLVFFFFFFMLPTGNLAMLGR